MMRRTPVATAQKPMYMSSTSVVIPGAWNVMTPKAMPSRPSSRSTHQLSLSSRPVNAWNTSETPSTNANIAKKRTRLPSVMPGEVSATMPNRIATAPLNSSTHQ